MIMDATGLDFNWDASSHEELPNADVKLFYDMLEAADEPLWEIDINGETKVKCEKHTVLSAVTQCLNLKSDFQMTEDNFNRMMSIIKSMLPVGEKLPRDFYQAKKLVRGVSMEYKKIDVCPNNCMLYYKGEELLKDKCDICGEPRYKTPPTKKGKPIARKVLRYLPITSRLQRLYMVGSSAEHMRWYKEGFRENLNLMVHSADGLAWKYFVQLELSTDGFTPYSFNAPPYTCVDLCFLCSFLIYRSDM
jgi:hypothetical protein